MNLEQLIERLKEIQRTHPNAEIRFYTETERGSVEHQIASAEYFHIGKVVLLE